MDGWMDGWGQITDGEKEGGWKQEDQKEWKEAHNQMRRRMRKRHIRENTKMLRVLYK